MLEFVRMLEKAKGQSVRLSILDLILVETTTSRPYKWIYTDRANIVQVRRLSSISIRDVAQSLLANLVPSVSADYRNNLKVNKQSLNNNSKSYPIITMMWYVSGWKAIDGAF